MIENKDEKEKRGGGKWRVNEKGKKPLFNGDEGCFQRPIYTLGRRPTGRELRMLPPQALYVLWADDNGASPGMGS